MVIALYVLVLQVPGFITVSVSEGVHVVFSTCQREIEHLKLNAIVVTVLQVSVFFLDLLSKGGIALFILHICVDFFS